MRSIPNPAVTTTRRTALKSALGAILATGVAPGILCGETEGQRIIRLGLIGCGAQGSQLNTAVGEKEMGDRCHLVAVSDPSSYARRSVQKRQEAHQRQARGNDVDFECHAYADAREMLEREKLDAVLIATPDYSHHEYAIAAMERGLHVYCEAPISNSLESARAMVRAQRRTGMLLQIGHQRRSNPQYIHTRDKIVHGSRVLGDIINAEAVWSRAKEYGAPKLVPTNRPRPWIDDATLVSMGYATGFEGMYQALNWEHFRRTGSGAFGLRAALQLDVINWFFKTPPVSVSAMATHLVWPPEKIREFLLEEYQEELRQEDGDTDRSRLFSGIVTTIPNLALETFPDVVFCQFKYRRPGPDGFRESLAHYRFVSGGTEDPRLGSFREEFMGEDAMVRLSEMSDRFALWPKIPKVGTLGVPDADTIAVRAPEEYYVGPGTLGGVDPSYMWKLPESVQTPRNSHLPHLANFLDTLLAGGRQGDLACPAEEAFRTLVTVLKVYEAIEKRATLNYTPEEFEVT